MVLFMSQYRIILLHNDAPEKKLVDPSEMCDYIIVRDTKVIHKNHNSIIIYNY